MATHMLMAMACALAALSRQMPNASRFWRPTPTFARYNASRHRVPIRYNASRFRRPAPMSSFLPCAAAHSYGHGLEEEFEDFSIDLKGLRGLGGLQSLPPCPPPPPLRSRLPSGRAVNMLKTGSVSRVVPKKQPSGKLAVSGKPISKNRSLVFSKLLSSQNRTSTVTRNFNRTAFTRRASKGTHRKGGSTAGLSVLKLAGIGLLLLTTPLVAMLCYLNKQERDEGEAKATEGAA